MFTPSLVDDAQHDLAFYLAVGFGAQFFFSILVDLLRLVKKKIGEFGDCTGGSHIGSAQRGGPVTVDADV